MKEIKGIGFSIPSENEEYIGLDSFSSLADTDIAIFCPKMSTTSYSVYDNYSSTGKYEGKKLYNKESSAIIQDHINHWRKELSHFVENGGTLFIVLTQIEEFYIYSGTKDISGTGRNQKITHHVAPVSNYQYLPFKNFEYFHSSGKSIIPQSNLVIDLFNQFKDFFKFDTYLQSNEIGNIIFTTKNKDRILGTISNIKKGFLIFLPNINFDISEFTTYDKKSGTEFWTDEAITKGKIFVNCVVEIDKTLRKQEERTPKPDWLNASSFNLSESIKTRKLIEKNKKEIEKRNNEIVNLNLILEEQESLKDLLFETGKPLENAVIKALKILGYQAENYNDGELELDQIIVSPEGHRFIGECEGKDSKDIDVSKFRQLLDGLNADFEKETVLERANGLIFGNAQRLILPNARNLDFTKKCQQGALREKVGLIRTIDLFFICKYLIEKNDPEFAEKCREAVLQQLGQIIEFPKS